MSGEETEEEEEADIEEEENRDRETPRGAPLEFIRVGGGACPPWGKTRTSRTLPRTVRTYCCGNSMETFHIKTMGCTWAGELRTTLSGIVVGAG